MWRRCAVSICGERVMCMAMALCHSDWWGARRMGGAVPLGLVA